MGEPQTSPAFDWPRPTEDWTIPALEQGRVAVQDRMLALDAETSSIKSQLEDARSKVAEAGIYSDRDWYRKANVALRIKGRERQRCQQLLADINRLLRKKNAAEANNSQERRFISAAKAMLPPETYAAIWQSANHGEHSFEEETP